MDNNGSNGRHEKHLVAYVDMRAMRLSSVHFVADGGGESAPSMRVNEMGKWKVSGAHDGGLQCAQCGYISWPAETSNNIE